MCYPTQILKGHDEIKITAEVRRYAIIAEVRRYDVTTPLSLLDNLKSELSKIKCVLVKNCSYNMLYF
jgi:hypothetical protein